MLITDARLRHHGDTLHDVEITGGLFTSVTPATGTANRGRQDVLDADGALLTAPFVDAHVHLDYANTVGQPRHNTSGTLFEAIDIWADHKAQGYVTRESVLENAATAVRAEVGNGVGFLRTHVDVTDPALTALDAVLELKDRVRDWCHLQVIAFPQNGILASPGGEELLAEAMRRGADVVGGIPHFERSREAGVASLRHVFDLAERHDALIDVHCDEIDDDQSRFLEVMAELTVERGLVGRVTASHAVAMAYYGPGYMAKLVPKLVQAQMRFAVNPTENLQLQGWGQSAPMARGVAPIGQLDAAGLNVAMGQDSIADPWYPIGEGDLLRVLESGLHVGHLLSEPVLQRCLDFISDNGARNMGLEDYGVRVGTPADAILLDARDDKDALWHHADVLASIRGGRTVFRRPRRGFLEAMPGLTVSDAG
ncbi:amidohydrolase family protein [Brachybacterium squillarum]|uniref:amidohydrolase family protein n=1 Tax=Brachybacterium squillarum TaxID=661979 RepID=UPI002221DA02|nr:amidohydrolase family protein [Brachybacterium squillarum]MCW1805029.1 amidohydrolase family protein [Brachybacterium squillarum]